MTEKYRDAYMDKWVKKTLILKDFPKDWEVAILSEKDPRINPVSWNLGQIGMVIVDGKTIIKPAYQEGVKEGELRIIFIRESPHTSETSRVNFYEDVLG